MFHKGPGWAGLCGWPRLGYWAACTGGLAPFQPGPRGSWPWGTGPQTGLSVLCLVCPLVWLAGSNLLALLGVLVGCKNWISIQGKLSCYRLPAPVALILCSSSSSHPWERFKQSQVRGAFGPRAHANWECSFRSDSYMPPDPHDSPSASEPQSFMCKMQSAILSYRAVVRIKWSCMWKSCLLTLRCH